MHILQTLYPPLKNTIFSITIKYNFEALDSALGLDPFDGLKFGSFNKPDQFFIVKKIKWILCFFLHFRLSYCKNSKCLLYKNMPTSCNMGIPKNAAGFSHITALSSLCKLEIVLEFRFIIHFSRNLKGNFQ